MQFAFWRWTLLLAFFIFLGFFQQAQALEGATQFPHPTTPHTPTTLNVPHQDNQISIEKSYKSAPAGSSTLRKKQSQSYPINIYKMRVDNNSTTSVKFPSTKTKPMAVTFDKYGPDLETAFTSLYRHYTVLVHLLITLGIVFGLVTCISIVLFVTLSTGPLEKLLKLLHSHPLFTQGMVDSSSRHHALQELQRRKSLADRCDQFEIDIIPVSPLQEGHLCASSIDDVDVPPWLALQHSKIVKTNYIADPLSYRNQFHQNIGVAGKKSLQNHIIQSYNDDMDS